jgi:hypothetical protein
MEMHKFWILVKPLICTYFVDYMNLIYVGDMSYL